MEQICGKPDANAGDHQNAWASATQATQPEWLIVRFEKSVFPSEIEVYENLKPGFVNKVTVFDSKGKEHEAWKGQDPAKPGKNGVHVARIPLDANVKTNKVKIYINNPAIKTWYEVDAVQLTGKNGVRQWVIQAEASSCYADRGKTVSNSHKLIHDLIFDKR